MYKITKTCKVTPFIFIRKKTFKWAIFQICYRWAICTFIPGICPPASNLAPVVPTMVLNHQQYRHGCVVLAASNRVSEEQQLQRCGGLASFWLHTCMLVFFFFIIFRFLVLVSADINSNGITQGHLSGFTSLPLETLKSLYIFCPNLSFFIAA